MSVKILHFSQLEPFSMDRKSLGQSQHELHSSVHAAFWKISLTFTIKKFPLAKHHVDVLLGRLIWSTLDSCCIKSNEKVHIEITPCLHFIAIIQKTIREKRICLFYTSNHKNNLHLRLVINLFVLLQFAENQKSWNMKLNFKMFLLV